MTLEEFSNEFDILYNNITSNLAPGLDEYEKSVFLTKSLDEILKAYFDPKSNKVGEGFDDSERRQIDFSMLINTFLAEEFPGVSTLYPVSNAKLYNFPSDILMVINESLMVRRGNYIKYLSVVPLNYREYDRLMSKPYKRPIKNQAWRLLTNSVSTVVSSNNTKPTTPDFSEDDDEDTGIEAGSTVLPTLPDSVQIDIPNFRLYRSKNISKSLIEDMLLTDYIDSYFGAIYALGTLYGLKGADVKKTIKQINGSFKISIVKEEAGYRLELHDIANSVLGSGYSDIKDSDGNIIYFQENDLVFIDSGYDDGIDTLYTFVNILCYPILQKRENGDTITRVFKPDQDTDEIMRVMFNGALWEAVYNGYSRTLGYTYSGDTSIGYSLYLTINLLHRNNLVFITDILVSIDATISNYYLDDVMVTLTDDMYKIGGFPINTEGKNSYRFGSGEGLPYIVVPLNSSRKFNVTYGGSSTYSFDSRVYLIAKGYINRYLNYQYATGSEEDFDYSDSGNSGGGSESETEVFGKIQISSTSINVNEGETYTGKLKLDLAPTNNLIVTVSISNSNCSVNPTTFTFTPDNYNTELTYYISTLADHTTTSNKTSVVTFSTTNSIVNCSVTIINTDVDSGGDSDDETEAIDPDTIIVNDPNHRLSDSDITVFDLYIAVDNNRIYVFDKLFKAKNADTYSYGWGYPQFMLLTACYIKISKTTGSTVDENEYRLNMVIPNRLLSGNYDLSVGKFRDLNNNEIVFKENDECITEIGGIQKLFDAINYLNYPLIQINQPDKVVEEFITPNDLHLAYARYKIVESLLSEAGTTFTDTYAAGINSWTTDSKYAASKLTFTNIVNNISAYYLQNHRSNHNYFEIDNYGGFPYRVGVSTDSTGKIDVGSFLMVNGEIKDENSDIDYALSNGNFLVIQNLQGSWFNFPYYTKVITGNTIKFNSSNGGEDGGGGEGESNVYGNICILNSGTSATTYEGRSILLAIVLDKAPTSNLIVTVTTSNLYCSIDKSTLTFTPDNYNLSLIVRVTALETSNTNDRSTIITFSSTNVTSKEFIINIHDSSVDPTPAISNSIIAPNNITVPNLSSKVVYVSLDKQPSENYTVTTGAYLISTLSTSPTLLIFTSSNWNVPLAMSISANGSGSYLLEFYTRRSSDLEILSLSNINVEIDGEVSWGAIVVNKSSIELTRGNSTTIGVALESAPTLDLKVTASLSSSSGISIDSQELIFTPLKYNQYLYITITGNTVGDYILTLSSTHYNKSVTISVKASSNEEGGGEEEGGGGGDTPVYGNIVVNKNSISVIEGNTTTFTVKLSKSPSSSLTISINTSSGVSVSPSTLVFNSSNWNTVLTVNVTGIQYGIHSIVLSSKNVSSVTIQLTVVSSSSEGGGGMEDVTITSTNSKGIAEVIPGPNDTIIRYTLRYVKKPMPIILDKLEGVTIGGYVGLNSEGKPTSSIDEAISGIPCELDPILHKEILQRAVELAKAAYSGGLLEQIIVGNQSATEKGYIPQSK